MEERQKIAFSKLEFFIVVLLGFGFPIYWSSLYLIRMEEPILTNLSIYGLLTYEISTFFAIFIFLRSYGWSLQDFNFQTSWRDVVIGICLVFGTYFIYLICFFCSSLILNSVGHNLIEQFTLKTQADIGPIVGLSVVNPFFEEVLLLGYIVKILKESKGICFAVNISTLIRFSYHTYQGPSAVIAIIPTGLLFAYFFARTNKLMPVIIAHSLMDYISLTTYI